MQARTDSGVWLCLVLERTSTDLAGEIKPGQITGQRGTKNGRKKRNGPCRQRLFQSRKTVRRRMDIDHILEVLHAEQVEYLLIGGVNFLLRHEPEMTFDVDIWVNDHDENLARLNRALRRLGAEWGPTEQQWAPVPEDPQWLRRQPLFCLTTRCGALDVFREVKGLEGEYDRARAAAVETRTSTGIPYAGLSDRDMLRCQEALPLAERKPRRMEALRRAIERGTP
jgi:hypothetical protein